MEENKKNILNFFAEIIRNELGIVYQDANLYQLETRLKSITKQLGFSSLEDLYTDAKRTMKPDFKLLLLDSATNNETSFFRDEKVFHLIAKLYHSHNRENKGKPFRIWSAACSKGQEIYSVAMAIDESGASPSKNYHIVATDISERVLTQAKKGEYTQLEVQRGLSSKQLVKYFTHSDLDPVYSWKVNSSLKQNVIFRKQNLLDPFPIHEKYDLILCRNVLIYQDVANRKNIVSRLIDSLVPNGSLILGSAESLIGITDKLCTQRDCDVTYFSNTQSYAGAV